jgi:hypothetical protein
MDLPVAPVQLHRAFEGDGGQRGLERRDLAEVGACQAQLLGDSGALIMPPRRGELGLEPGDLGRDLADVVLNALQPFPHHGLARDLVGHDLGARIRLGIDLVAVPVVPVKVGVDDVAHGLRREVAQMVHDDPGRRGLAVRVDDDQAVVRLDDRRIAVDLVRGRGHRDVHAVGDLLNVEARVAAVGALMSAAVHSRLDSFCSRHCISRETRKNDKTLTRYEAPRFGTDTKK